MPHLSAIVGNLLIIGDVFGGCLVGWVIGGGSVWETVGLVVGSVPPKITGFGELVGFVFVCCGSGLNTGLPLLPLPPVC